MKTRAGVYGATAVFLLACCAAMGLVREIEGDESLSDTGIPKDIQVVTNKYDRVYGHIRNDVACCVDGNFVMSNTACFYFKGGTDRLNAFLRDVSRCTVLDCEVVLTTMPGRAKRWSEFVYESEEKDTGFKYDWRVVLDELPCRDGETSEWAVKVVVPIASEEKLAAIRIPLAFRASLGGRMAKFVRIHNARREELSDSRSKPSSYKPLGPTDISHTESVFDDDSSFASSRPTTQPSGGRE